MRCFNDPMIRSAVPKFFTVLFLFIGLFSCRYNPVVEGEYQLRDEQGGLSYTFRTDSSFSMKNETLYTCDTCCGHYYRTKDSLYLSFDTLARRTVSTARIDSSWSGRTDSVQLIVHTEDAFDRPIGNMFLTVSSSMSFKRTNVRADSSGTTTLLVSANDFPLGVSVISGGFYATSVHLDSAMNYAVTFHLHLAKDLGCSGGGDASVRIKKFNERKIVLMSEYMVVEEGGVRFVKEKLRLKKVKSVH